MQHTLVGLRRHGRIEGFSGTHETNREKKAGEQPEKEFFRVHACMVAKNISPLDA